MQSSWSFAAFFKDNPLRRPCRFVWCGAEEIGLEGSRHYARSLSPDSLRQIVLNINIDLAGQLIGVNHAVVSAEESLCHILQFLAAHSGIGLTVRQGIFPPAMPAALLMLGFPL